MRLIPLLACLIASSLPAAVVVEVSPTGKFASLEAARNEVRKLKRNGVEGPFEVVVRQGDYRVDDGIVLVASDSGVTYRAAEGETARLFGGKIIPKSWFQPVQDQAFLSRLTDSKMGSQIIVADLKEHGITDFGEMTRHGWSLEPKDRLPPATINIDGQRMTLARWPNADEQSPFMVYKHFLAEDRPLRGYELRVQEIIENLSLPGEVTLTRVVDPGGKGRGGGKGGTLQVAFDRMKHWHDIPNVFLDGVLGSTWEWTYNQLASVDVSKRQITLAYPELHGIGQGESVRLPHFHFQNIPEEIDTPREYYLDRVKGLLYLCPPKQFSTVVLSTLAGPMITINGASDIRFEGLQFDTGRNLGVSIRRGRNVTIDQCRIANFTAGGVDVVGSNVRVINSHIHGMGGFGVSLDGGSTATLEPAGNEVVNCHIHDFGWEQKSQLPGVIIDGVGHRVANNKIHDGPHFAIRVKGKNDVLIEHNEIHDLPKYHKFDGGALYVYTGPRAESRGIVIRGNYFHDIPTIGVYPDNFSWGVEISHNLFRNVGVMTNRPPINVNGGGECRSFNNIMIDCVMMYGQGARAKEERWFESWNKTLLKFGNGKVEQTPYHKYQDLKVWLAKKKKNEFFRPRSDVYNNLLYHPRTSLYRETASSQSKPDARTRRLQDLGIKDNSGHLYVKNNVATTKDPGFVDYNESDFRLRRDAPIFRQIEGFEAVPFEKMGRREVPVK
ncbi:hypothetical protein CA13_64880 [Planctomycetes bacterium CA13]|uniref:Right handed beta helix domain-containing protein n=1 Tax=Novipirellula herctigrandis TaxID=2527986 RepID=A0A5C5ZCV6_9BACT|nr:hypothetical protein CA13_64880 [Planctomycetes bacterium CA13]